jgi:hypothetical protein
MGLSGCLIKKICCLNIFFEQIIKCINLLEINIDNPELSIGKSVFAFCENLESINLNVKSINKWYCSA